MNLIFLKEFFANHSLSSIITALLITGIVILADKLPLTKRVKGVLYLLPFILGILFNFVYNCILAKKVFINSQILSAGFMSGWLSVAVKVIINKLIKGEKLEESKSSLVISGLIEGYIDKESISNVCKAVEELLCNHVNESDTIGKIAGLLSQNAVESFSYSDMLALAGLIFSSTKQIKE